MSFIDLTDDEGMFGLYVDLVVDAREECHDDPERLGFVEDMLTELHSMEDALESTPASEVIQRLEVLHQSVDRGFEDDPVAVHLRHLVDELAKLDDSTPTYAAGDVRRKGI